MLKINDFEVRCFRYGSRVQNGPEYAYKIIYHAANGKDIQLDRICYRKKDAERYIRETIKLASLIANSRESGEKKGV